VNNYDDVVAAYISDELMGLERKGSLNVHISKIIKKNFYNIVKIETII